MSNKMQALESYKVSIVLQGVSTAHPHTHTV